MPADLFDFSGQTMLVTGRRRGVVLATPASGLTTGALRLVDGGRLAVKRPN